VTLDEAREAVIALLKNKVLVGHDISCDLQVLCHQHPWLMFETQTCTIMLGSVRNGCHSCCCCVCRYRLVPANAMHSLWMVKIGSAKVGEGSRSSYLVVCLLLGRLRQDRTTSGGVHDHWGYTKQFSPLTAADLEKDPVTFNEARKAVIAFLKGYGGCRPQHQL